MKNSFSYLSIALTKNLFPKVLDLLHKERFKRFGALVERGLLWVIIAAVIKDFCHITNKFSELGVGV